MSDLTASAPAVALAQVSIGGAWNVQGAGDNTAFAAKVRRVFAVDLPRTPNTMARGASLTAFWLGPASWLLAGESALPLHEFIAARDAINAAGGALFDVSASRVAFRVEGPRAPDVLAAGCPLDFGERDFPTDSCRQSLLFRVAALVERNDDAPTYTVYVARSLAAGVWKAVAVSAAEYGYEPRPWPAPA